MKLADVGRAVLAAAQWPILQEQGLEDSAAILTVSISDEWSMLGPFQIGTREAIWGADPLERYGGFHALKEEDKGTFPSSLAFNGSVTWQQGRADTGPLPAQEFQATLDVAFPDIDWQLLQQVYGWSALQWQAWVRGKLINTSDQPVIIWMHLKQVLEFWIDDEHYFGGDLYGFNRAPTTLTLTPGEHKIEFRLIRDIRAMGGITNNPNVQINVHISATHPALRRSTGVMLPDRLNNERGPTASTFATVVLRNDNDVDIYITSVKATYNLCRAELVQQHPMRLVPGQSRPVGFRISCLPGTSAINSIRLFFYYHTADDEAKERFLFAWGFPRRPQPQTEPHRLTYLHPGGVVSYATIRPPIVNLCPANQTLPVLLFLHGAGVEADDDEVKHSLDNLPPLCAWTLIPSGVTSWSGDDWHDWGWADVLAAINSIPSWIEHADWTGPGVDVSKWVVTGHSNGGQGTWHALTHFPDNVMAAAPVSGYCSIEEYVPYTGWHIADDQAMSIVRRSLLGHRNEIMLENAGHIPLLVQHGSADDNVPAYHSRLMHDRLQELAIPHALVELEGQPHWWDGVMTTPELSQFFEANLGPDRLANEASEKRNFSLVTANPGNTGSKHGFTITELVVPGQIGRLSYNMSGRRECLVKTRNVQSLAVSDEAATSCQTIEIDGTTMSARQGFTATKVNDSGRWVSRDSIKSSCRRSPDQQGGLEAILRSKGTFQIVKHSRQTDHIALQIANNFCQYFAADVEVVDEYADAVAASGSIISIAVGADLPPSMHECGKCKISLGANHITVPSKHGLHRYSKTDDDLAAAIFLRTLPDARLELVVWASAIQHLGLAARLVPTLTGSGQPDFIVARSSMSYEGIGGVLAMGFFDGDWCASPASSFFIDG